MIPQGYWQDGKYILVSTLQERLDAALAALLAKDEEIARLREWQRQMVEKAASGGVLEGYRELGAKAAAAESRADAAEQRIRELTTRDGNFLDKWGCCRVCGGEIPNGHTAECDIWKKEQRTRELETALREARRRVQLIHAQYMGAGGNLNSAEVVAAMQRECVHALARIDALLEVK